MGTTMKKSVDLLVELSSPLHPKKSKQETSLLQCEMGADILSLCNVYFFSGINGIVCHTFAPQEPTVNQHFYTDILSYLWDDIWQQQPDKWHIGHWLTIITITLLSMLYCVGTADQSWYNSCPISSVLPQYYSFSETEICCKGKEFS